MDKDHKDLQDLNKRLANANAISAELMAEMDEKNSALQALNQELANSNAIAAELMVELEEKNNSLRQTNKEVAKANVHAAELISILETKEEKIAELNKSLSSANAFGAELVAERELALEELAELNKKLNKEIKVRIAAETEIKKTADELAKLIATKDKFFSIIAHDLKNPFGAIIGFSEILDLDYDNMDDTERKSMVDMIHKSSNNAYDLLINLLDWSRIQTGSISLNREVFNLEDGVNNTIALLEHQASMKNIKIKTQNLSNKFVFADKNMIVTVIRNLISNAIKFSYSKSEIIVSCEIMNNLVKVGIKDSGTGISKENIKRLFKIKEQYTEQGTSKETGTGLGLILCEEFINRNKGTIWVESILGKGSTFYFTIPVK
ncbi:MAG: hypothetical protein K9J13_15695 [Saprospiraceae bacterium]|nr:hypothetical protein [Saprospiraceae bacterium]